MAYKLAPPPPSSPKIFSLRHNKEESALGSTSPSPSIQSSPASSRNSTMGRSSIQTTISTVPSSPPSSPMKNEQAILVSTVEVGEEEKERYPTAVVDVERISDVMAARLVTCLLGHVLFLKGQIPFPIAQLLRMALTRRSDPRTMKKHDALLSSFDVLSSHLGSTFTALSTALAIGRRRRSHSAPEVDHKPPRTGENYTPLRLPHDYMSPEEKIHIALVIGPSVTSASAARARVILEICGLEVKAWGEGFDSPQKSRSLNDRSLRAGGVLVDISGSECGNDEHDVDEPGDDSFDSDEESVPDSDSSDDASDEEYDQEEDEYSETDTEEVIRTAERLLSRVLAVANADPDLGMAAELQPSQTHILLHAPRRFTHPSWIPRQALGRDMDQFLSAFDTSPSKATNTKKNSQFKVKTECVRVRCKASLDPEEIRDEDIIDEEGQLIWWSWDGKLEGFSDF